MLWMTSAVMAEETIVVGTVRDGRTGEPVENANVWYKNTDIGCATNNEGLFMVRTDLDKKRTLLVSAVGYKKQKYTIEPGQYAGIEVELEEENTQLADVFIVPGANPALPLMDRVRSKRAENDMLSRSGVSYTQAESKELYISDIRQKHLQRMLWKSLQSGMLTAEDSTMIVPLYISRSASKMASGKKSYIAAPEEKSVVLTETDFSALLEGLPEHFDFYKNNITVFGKSFISPLASSGNSHYNYYLADSLIADSAAMQKTYVVHFHSKNPYEPSFNGEMLIDSATCALRSISVSVPREVSINYLTSLRVNKTYDEQFLPENEDMSMIFDFAIKADTSHVFPTVLLKRQKQKLQTLSLSTEMPEDSIVFDADSLLAVDSVSYDAFTRLEDSNLIRTAKIIAYIITTGNVPVIGEKVDLGNAVEMIGMTTEEGIHIGVPVATNEKLWKNVELSGYIAYGFRDRAMKGKGQIRALLPTPRRNLIGAYYWDHYAPTDYSRTDYFMRENTVFYGEQDLAHMLFGGLTYNTQQIIPRTRKREFQIWTENDLTDNVETEFAFRMGRMGYGSPMVGYKNIPSFRYRTLIAAVRLGWGERKVYMFVRRRHIHSQYPIVRLVAEAGSWQLDAKQSAVKRFYEESNLYARLTLLVQQTIPLGVVGTLDYSMQAGMVFGTVPYPLLEHFVGNQSYTYDPYRFTLMNFHQYTADRFVLAHLHWNMQGAIFNRIPYIQRLHLRELVEFKFAYGALDDKHSKVLELPEGMGKMRVPYVEAGIGIGNILRLADLYAVFRLTDLKNTTTPWWAIRVRFSFGM